MQNYGSPCQGLNLHFTTLAICYEERSANGEIVPKVKLICFNKPTYIGDIDIIRILSPFGNVDCYMITGVDIIF